MQRITSLVAAVMLCTFSSVNAQSSPEDLSPEQLSFLLPNMAGDLAMCSAFFEVVSECMNNTQPGSGEQFYTLSLQVLQQSAVMTGVSSGMTLRAAGQAVDDEKVSNAALKSAHLNYKSHKKEMLEEMQTCEHLNILNSQHLEPCIGYVQNPDSLMEKWVQQLQDQ